MQTTNEGLLEVNILGVKFKTLGYLQNKLPGRGGKGRIHYKTLCKYIDKGMPHFEYCGQKLFSDADLEAIPQWIAANCRRAR